MKQSVRRNAVAVAVLVFCAVAARFAGKRDIETYNDQSGRQANIPKHTGAVQRLPM